MFDRFWKTQAETPQTPEHAKAHGRIGMWGVVFMFVFLLLGLGFAGILFWISELPKLVDALLAGATIAVFTTAGLGFGVAVGCLQAPREFLDSFDGRSWLKLVGARSAKASRVICIITVATVLTLSAIAVQFTVRAFNEQ